MWPRTGKQPAQITIHDCKVNLDSISRSQLESAKLLLTPRRFRSCASVLVCGWPRIHTHARTRAGSKACGCGVWGWVGARVPILHKVTRVGVWRIHLPRALRARCRRRQSRTYWPRHCRRRRRRRRRRRSSNTRRRCSPVTALRCDQARWRTCVLKFINGVL